MDGTLDKVDLFMIKTYLCKSLCRGDDFAQNFFVDELLADYMSWTTTYAADYDQANKIVLAFVLVLGSEALFYLELNPDK